MKNFMLGLILAGTLAGPAAADRTVQPKASDGPVYHLFGPNSLSTNFLPSIGGIASGGSSHTSQAGTGGQKPAQNTHYTEPSTHDILREMFVTGDPNAKPGQSFAKGRAGMGQAN